MINKEKIKNIIELFIAWNGETEAIDVANLDSAVDFIADSLQEEPVSKDLEEFALQYAGHHAPYDSCMQEVEDAVKAGAKWKKEQMMKDANTYIVERHYDKYVGKYLTPDVTLNEQVYKVGDLVKIIIIKES